MLSFGDVEPFLLENEDIENSLRPKLLALFSDCQTKSKLRVEIAATVDWASLLSRHVMSLKEMVR